MECKTVLAYFEPSGRECEAIGFSLVYGMLVLSTLLCLSLSSSSAQRVAWEIDMGRDDLGRPEVEGAEGILIPNRPG